MDKERKKTLKGALVRLVIGTALIIFCLFTIKTYGNCAGWIVCAISATAIFIDSWLDREHRAKLRERSAWTWTFLSWILCIIVIWIIAFLVCAEYI